jgi:hypothetical protein
MRHMFLVVFIFTCVSGIAQEKKIMQPKPRVLFFGEEEDHEEILEVIRKAGFDVTLASSDKVDCEEEEIEKALKDLKDYRLVMVLRYDVCYQGLAEALGEFVKAGGGVIIFSGVPTFLSHEEPGETVQGIREIDEDIAEWFGASRYANSRGTALIEKDNPFGLKFEEEDEIDEAGPGAAAIPESHLEDEAEIIGVWESGHIWAFTYTYGKGRVYYQSTADSQESLELLKAAALWAANIDNK